MCTWNRTTILAKTHIKTQPTRTNLRSSMDPYLLVIPRTKCKTFADRSFSIAGPTLWNKLPKRIRSTHTLLSFKKDLKTYLFNCIYNSTLYPFAKKKSLYQPFSSEDRGKNLISFSIFVSHPYLMLSAPESPHKAQVVCYINNVSLSNVFAFREVICFIFIYIYTVLP